MTTDPTADDRRTRWQVFTSWHRTESLWRELYARTVSALAAALVIYLIAAASGVVSRRPVAWLAALGTLAALAGTIRDVRRNRGHAVADVSLTLMLAGTTLVAFLET